MVFQNSAEGLVRQSSTQGMNAKSIACSSVSIQASRPSEHGSYKHFRLQKQFVRHICIHSLVDASVVLLFSKHQSTPAYVDALLCQSEKTISPEPADRL